MAGQRFTPNYLSKLELRAKPYRVYDGGGEGLGVQVHPSGRVSFFVAWRAPGASTVRTLTIGSFPQHGTTTDKERAIKAAKDKAAALREERRRGLDPVEQETERNAEAQRREREAAEARARDAAIGSVKMLFDAYVDSLKRRGARSWPEIKRALDKEALPILGANTKAKDVGPLDVRAVLVEIVGRDARHYANRVRGYLNAAFRFGIEDDLGFDKAVDAPMFGLTHNPVRDVPRPLKNEKVGERALTEREFRRLWLALAEPKSFGIWSRLALRLILVAGGQRIQETLRAEWAHFDQEAGVWTMPKGTTKNARPHAIPITPAINAVLKEIKAHETLKAKEQERDAAHRLFPGGDGEGTRFRSINQALRRWIAKCAEEGEPIAHFVARDLRRSVKTLMGDLGIPKATRDQLMNHAQAADVSARHYDRAAYLPEKRAALDLWSSWIESKQSIAEFRRKRDEAAAKPGQAPAKKKIPSPKRAPREANAIGKKIRREATA